VFGHPERGRHYIVVAHASFSGHVKELTHSPFSNNVAILGQDHCWVCVNKAVITCINPCLVLWIMPSDVAAYLEHVVRRRHHTSQSRLDVLLGRRAAGPNALLSAHGVIVRREQGWAKPRCSAGAHSKTRIAWREPKRRASWRLLVVEAGANLGQSEIAGRNPTRGAKVMCVCVD
jgi:hypothetical protein